MENQFENREKPLLMYATEVERATFFKKTYLHVAMAVLAFVLVESILLKIEPVVHFMLGLTQSYLWLVLLGMFWVAGMIADRFAHSMNRGQQYLGLGIYVIFEAIIFVPLLYIATTMEGGAEVIKQAAIVTLSLFTGLTAVVFMTNTNFSFLRTSLVIGTFIAAGAIIASIIFGLNLGLFLSLGMIVLAGIAILYQTSQLKYEYGTDQYVGAALGLFSSLMLLFWYVLRIFMSRN